MIGIGAMGVVHCAVVRDGLTVSLSLGAVGSFLKLTLVFYLLELEI